MIINMRPVGWDDMTPRQWGAVREMVRAVYEFSKATNDYGTALRALVLLDYTEGRDV